LFLPLALRDTLVVWGGEFGRTPTVQVDKVEPGRDHHPERFTIWMAGGGVKGGFLYGRTDEYSWSGFPTIFSS
jgi:uncharacterized protein (DUF1501 family)